MNFTEAYAELENIQEALRVVSDPDKLYHWTNPLPFFKIFNEDCLRADVHLNAVCLTTDQNYQIYGYPCGMQLSREKLAKAGHELIPFDEFEHDTTSKGESEERIEGNIDNLSKYVEIVFINWDNIELVASVEGYRIADATYEAGTNNENECYDLMYTDFRKLLTSLKSKGIRVLAKSKPHCNYHLDDAGKLRRSANIG